MLSLIEDSGTDIAVLTETWLQRRLTLTTKGYMVAQSPSAHNQGVMIVATNTRIREIQPIHPALWTTNTVVVKACLKQSNSAIFIIGHYSQPGQSQSLNEEIAHFVQLLRHRSQTTPIIIGGDLNRNHLLATELATNL